MFSNLSNVSNGVDTAFAVILGIEIFLMIGLTAVLLFFIFKYRASKHPKAEHIDGNHKLELIWTVIPLALVMLMFYYGWEGYKPFTEEPPEGSYTIKSTARMWSWYFDYPTGKGSDTLYIPAGKPVNIELESADVLHSFYIPAFRVKRDIVPNGGYNIWFVANSPGIYDLFCAEYCGTNHSYMITKVKVLTQEDFAVWEKEGVAPQPGGKDFDPVKAGKAIVKKNGCLGCHTIDGGKSVGPSYKGLFGRDEKVVTDGATRTVKVDEDYIKKSVYYPNADVVEGYAPNQMVSYEGMVSEEELGYVVEYIKSLQ